VRVGASAISCTAPSRRRIVALSVTYQEDTRYSPFKTRPPSVQKEGCGAPEAFKNCSSDSRGRRDGPGAPDHFASSTCQVIARYQHDARGPAPRGNFLSAYPMRKSMFRKDRCALRRDRLLPLQRGFFYTSRTIPRRPACSKKGRMMASPSRLSLTPPAIASARRMNSSD
jgi:hypothetical protein